MAQLWLARLRAGAGSAAGPAEVSSCPAVGVLSADVRGAKQGHFGGCDHWRAMVAADGSMTLRGRLDRMLRHFASRKDFGLLRRRRDPWHDAWDNGRHLR